MQNTSTASLVNAQRLTRAASFVIVTTSYTISLQFALLHLHCSSVGVLHQVPAFLYLTRCRTPQDSLPLLDQVAAPPARALALRRATCPHVGHGPQPTLEAPREGLRQGDVGGGAGRKLSRPAPKPNVAGVSQVPRQDLLRLVRNGHGDTHTREPEFRQQ